MNTEIRPLVTIGIPTYNRADGYLKEALECALAQTYPNIEIVVADNGSTDNTGAVVQSYGDPRIRYFRHNPPIKPNDNFNFCLSQASGIYFQLLHDDDLIDCDFIECCMQAAEYRTDVGIIRTGARIIDAHGKILNELRNDSGGLSTAEFFLAWLDSRTWMFLSSVLFNTARLREIGGFNSKHQLFQDVLAEFEVAARFGRVDVPDVKASFRKHGSQRTGAALPRLWCEDSVYLLQAMCRLAAEQQGLIRRKGREHFAKHNYELASSIRSPVDRYGVYLLIYRTFDHAYSPLRYFGARAHRRLFTWLGRVKRFMRGKMRVVS